MKAYRLSKGVTEHYTSLEELRAAFGLKPLTKQTKNNDKLAIQRSRFCNKNLCPVCKQPMEWIGGNLLVCKNENCTGYKHEVDTDMGENNIYYTPVFKILDEKSAEIANNLFTKYE